MLGPGITGAIKAQGSTAGWLSATGAAGDLIIVTVNNTISDATYVALSLTCHPY
jgi:hypothetical protein